MRYLGVITPMLNMSPLNTNFQTGISKSCHGLMFAGNKITTVFPWLELAQTNPYSNHGNTCQCSSTCVHTCLFDSQRFNWMEMWWFRLSPIWFIENCRCWKINRIIQSLWKRWIEKFKSTKVERIIPSKISYLTATFRTLSTLLW